MSFVITGIDPATYVDYWALDDESLASRQAIRVVVDASPGYPDRITLDDAPVGEAVLLVNHMHQPGDSPYRASGAVYLRSGLSEASRFIDAIPPALARRTLSMRAYDMSHRLVVAELVEGRDSAAAIGRLLGRGDVAYLHAHYAAYGCFAARVDRLERTPIEARG